MRSAIPLMTVTALATMIAHEAPSAPEPVDDSKPAPSIAMIPASSAAFLHFRIGEIWNSPLGKLIRASIAKDEPNFEAEAEKRMGIALNNIATATYVFQDLEKEALIMLVTTRRPFDKAKVLEAIQPMEPAKKISGFEVAQKSQRECFVFVNDRCFFYSSGHSPDSAVALAMKLQAVTATANQGPLRAALDHASKTGVISGGLNVKVIPPIPPGAQIGEPFVQLLPILKAETIVGTIELGDALRLDATVKFPNADDASKGEGAVQAGKNFLMAIVKDGIAAPVPPSPDRDFALQLLTEAKKSLDNAKIVREQADVRIQLSNEGLVAKGPTLATTIAAMIRKSRDSASRMVASSSLKQIGLAMHNHLAATGTMPPHAIYSKDGKTPLLSWRVAILPYLEHEELYKQFKLDEPWDSEHNKKLLARIPRIYKSPIAQSTKEIGRTHYVGFFGGGAFFNDGPKGIAPGDMIDGFSNTFMIVEAQDSVPWTKPDDIRFDPTKPVAKMGSDPRDSDFLVLFADGSVRSLKKSIAEKTLKALITRAGNEQIDMRELDK